jgi:hypothetical protein
VHVIYYWVGDGNLIMTQHTAVIPTLIHKGMSHVLKPMMKTAIKVDIFPAMRKRKTHQWIPQS